MLTIRQLGALNPTWFGLSAVLMWSTIAIGFKLGLRTLDPLQLLWLGCGFSWILFTISILILPSQTFKQNDVLKALGLGLLNPALYYLVLLSAYDLLPAHVAQPLNYTWAFVTALLAIPILRQKLRASTVVGMLVGYAGVLILVVTNDTTNTASVVDLTGVGLALLSSLLWALYWIASVRIRMKPWWFMWFGFTMAMPVITVSCIYTVGLPDMTMRHLGFGAWIGLLEMGFAFLMWQYAMAKTSSTANLSQLIFLAPLISIGLIYTVLRESINPSAGLAMALIFAGLFLTNRQTMSRAFKGITHGTE